MRSQGTEPATVGANGIIHDYGVKDHFSLHTILPPGALRVMKTLGR